MPGILALPQLVQPSILVRIIPRGKSWKLQKLSNVLTIWEWPLSYGVIPGTMHLKKRAWIITFQPILTGQANHLGVTIQADIIKQKLAENNGGYKALNTGGSSYGKLDERIYTELTSDHPIDLCRYQVANCYMGRAGLISSGGESKGASDLADAVRTAVINKRAGGMGLISGRKSFQRPLKEGVEILNAIQDVYLDKSIDLA